MGSPPRRENVNATKPGPPTSVWTEAKISAVLEALSTFTHNQARKHGVPVEQVWALIRDEVLDPGGPR